MRLRLGSPRAAVVVAPHPDDEVIGAYGLIRVLRSRGVRVHVLVVTDGAASHPSSLRWPRARLVMRRRRETRGALRRLGVPAGAVRFLGLPDGALPGCEAAAVRRIRQAVRRVRGLDLVVGPTPDDGHADHRVTAAALQALRGRVRRLAYPVWPAPILAGGRSRTLVVPGGALAKWAALATYRSQTGAITDDPCGFSLTRAQIAGFCRPLERFLELRP